MGENMYCGVGPIPKGKTRGTPEYCVQTNQVRYYGLEEIDESLLKQAKGTTSNLVKEQLKLKRIEDDAKILIREVKNLKIILEGDAKPSAQKRAQKRMDELLVKRDNLIKKLKSQKQVVIAIEKAKKHEDEVSKKKSSKSTKNSGSKTSKKSSGSKSSTSSREKSRKSSGSKSGKSSGSKKNR